jgi:hypothetical protein
MVDTAEEHDEASLASDDPIAQSGYAGDAARWRSARELIASGIDRPGTFLDVGCANGLLMESITEWSRFAIEPYGLDFGPGLVALAKRRLPRWADRIYYGDAATWTPSRRFDFVHVRLDLGHTVRIATWGARLIVSSDGSFRRPDSPKAEPVADRLRALGLNVIDERTTRSEEHQTELRVAWVDDR